MIKCKNCGVDLQPDEVHYFGNVCDNCEREWCERIEAWRHGGHDPELDRIFDDPAKRETRH